jgi:hypothetical protein
MNPIARKILIRLACGFSKYTRMWWCTPNANRLPSLCVKTAPEPQKHCQYKKKISHTICSSHDLLLKAGINSARVLLLGVIDGRSAPPPARRFATGHDQFESNVHCQTFNLILSLAEAFRTYVFTESSMQPPWIQTLDGRIRIRVLRTVRSKLQYSNSVLTEMSTLPTGVHGTCGWSMPAFQFPLHSSSVQPKVCHPRPLVILI